MKKSMFILTLMVAALCGCAAQQPTTLEPPETSVLVEVTPETSSGATPMPGQTHKYPNRNY